MTFRLGRLHSINRIRQRFQSYPKRPILRSWAVYLLQSFVALLIFILIVETAALIFSVSNVNNFFIHLNKWFEDTTKINYMQSMFQLGAATSIAFAIAGPQIQHALGPRVQGTIQHAKFAIDKPCAPIINLRGLIQALQNYDDYKRDFAAYTRSNLYPFHLSVASINLFLLVWSSIIDPRGEIPNKWAIIIIILCLIFPLIDLRDVFVDARHVRPILQEAKNACDSEMPTRIESVCRKLEAEIKPLPTDI